MPEHWKEIYYRCDAKSWWRIVCRLPRLRYSTPLWLMFPATVWFWLSEGRNFNGCVNLHRHFCWIPCRPWFQHSTRWLESCCDSAWQLVRCWCSVAQCCSISHRATSAPPNGTENAALISSQSISSVLFAAYRTSRVQCNVLSFVGFLVSENSLEWLHAPQSHQCEGIQHWARWIHDKNCLYCCLWPIPDRFYGCCPHTKAPPSHKGTRSSESSTFIGKVRCRSPKPLITLLSWPADRVRISSLNQCQNEASFLKSHQNNA